MSLGLIEISTGGTETIRVKTPGFPKGLPRVLDVHWIIRTKEGKRIHVTWRVGFIKYVTWRFGNGDVIGQWAFASFDSNKWGFKTFPSLLSYGSAMWISYSPLYYRGYGFYFYATSSPSTGKFETASVRKVFLNQICFTACLLNFSVKTI